MVAAGSLIMLASIFMRPLIYTFPRRLRSIAQRPRPATNSTRKKEAGERLDHSRLEVHAFINVGFSPPALVKVRKVVFSGADSRDRTELTSPNHPSF
jgi:hypothetical protein